MKQLLQSYRTGELAIEEVPPPVVRPGGVLVRTACSLVSPGTERAAIELARKSLVGKARARPDLVQKVFQKLQRDGVVATLRSVRARLDEPLALGYSSAGTVLEVGRGIEEFKPGDRVACAGAGHASHAEVVFVPRNLCVALPDGVGFEAGAFGTLGAVAMQGVRQAGVSVGERVGVVGLGLIGLLTCQILKAAGCRVFGIDVSPSRVEAAVEFGADEAVERSRPGLHDTVKRFSSGLGLDACIITAATQSSDPVELAGDLLRDRGRVVVVGAVGMDLPRRPYYEKELDLRLSRSYGPGRYDSTYEERGVDYPPGYVRWTERRNMESFLELVAAGPVNTEVLVTHRFPIDQALKAYQVVTGEGGRASMAIVLTYPEAEGPPPARVVVRKPELLQSVSGRTHVGIGLLGAGAFARSVLLPMLARCRDAELIGVVTATGATAKQAALRWGFRYCTSNYRELLSDDAIHAVVIATPHNVHAEQAVAAMRAGKDVFVEKPLALAMEQLQEVVAARAETGRRLLVGFNRRFSRAAEVVTRFLADVNGPLAVCYRVNAGALPEGHWLADPEIGGGRLLGEVCHFIDFLQFLGKSPVATVTAKRLFGGSDSVQVTMDLVNGSHGTILYLAQGAGGLSKERIECFAGRKTAVIEDFRRVELASGSRVKRQRLWRQDKGHEREWQLFLRALRGGSEMPIPFSEIVTTTLATLAAQQSLTTGEPVRVEMEIEHKAP